MIIPEDITRLTRGFIRYELLRKLNPRQFSDLYAESLKTGIAFDTLVDNLESAQTALRDGTLDDLTI